MTRGPVVRGSHCVAGVAPPANIINGLLRGMASVLSRAQSESVCGTGALACAAKGEARTTAEGGCATQLKTEAIRCAPSRSGHRRVKMVYF